ncbi:hypothetical protein ACWGPT_04445 [Pseudorhizobium sp. NPDC055634]
MILPTDAAFGKVATNLMHSVLESIEERRREDEEAATGKRRDMVAEARVSASTEAKRAKDKIAEALFSLNHVDPNQLKIELIERLVGKLGMDLEENRSNYALGKAIEDALKELDPVELMKLERDLGLRAMGITLDTLVAAIKNPHGDDNQRLMEGLSNAASGTNGFDVRRVLQRLEEVAAPKTLEELKLGPQGYDPTRVDDAQAQAERQGDIRMLEASSGLEAVQKMQEAASEVDSERATAEPAEADTRPDELLVLAAAVELAETVGPETQVPQDAPLPANGVAPAPLADVTAVNAEAAEELAASAAIDGEAATMIPVTVDEIGLYALLKKRPWA